MKEKTNENSTKNEVTATLNGVKICPKCGEIHNGDCKNDNDFVYDISSGNEIIYNKTTRKLDDNDEIKFFNFWNTHTGFHFHTGSNLKTFEEIVNRITADIVYDGWDDEDADEIFFTLFETEFLVTKEEFVTFDDGDDGVFEFCQMFKEDINAYFLVKKTGLKEFLN